MALGNNVLASLEACGPAQYDPEQYVCWNSQFLCPVTAGEPLSYCSGACYSRFMYTCTSNVLTLLPPADTAFVLTASNPKLPAVHNRPITAGGLGLVIGGTTSSYCPSVVEPNCPAGNITAIVAGEGRAAMNVMVPGGQQVYLDPLWSVRYTQAHSAYIPSGSEVGGLAAYKGGGFINLNGNGWGWVACPPTGSGGGDGVWTLVGRNESSATRLNMCTQVNLKVNPSPSGSIGAWQYT